MSETFEAIAKKEFLAEQHKHRVQDKIRQSNYGYLGK